ncbi:MAG: hypothetical protein HOE48_14880 [Candidatus Latescibacteria bacterium]|nr:hypothetical protein [Candidatus Latescibacterota bacterium]MBT4139202.1 hypothetical protein [Candidatus Latescibacterota bacterium]MBT5829664.1 hypothetical protein [Candidatus Latescibacterota bacterium]
MIDIDRSSIEAKVIVPEEGEGLVMEVVSPVGGKSVVTPPDGEFVNGTVSLWDDDLLWQVT